MNNDPDQARSVRRRALSRQARDAFPPMGVYAIRDTGSGRVRVGSSRNVYARLNRIRFELRLGAHPDKDLQESWRRNPAHLSFEVLDLVKERADAAFDYAEELRALERLHREELCGQGLS